MTIKKLNHILLADKEEKNKKSSKIQNHHPKTLTTFYKKLFIINLWYLIQLSEENIRMYICISLNKFSQMSKMHIQVSYTDLTRWWSSDQQRALQLKKNSGLPVKEGNELIMTINMKAFGWNGKANDIWKITYQRKRLKRNQQAYFS